MRLRALRMVKAAAHDLRYVMGADELNVGVERQSGIRPPASRG
jgi:hypothetical protein